MNQNSEFLEYILDLLDPLAAISSRKMFGGYAIYQNGLTIAIIAHDEIYLKVDESNIDDYKQLNSQPFTYQKQGKTITISNWKVPAEILEDQDRFIEWAEKSYQVALKAKRKK